MPTLSLVLLSALDILLYTIRSFTNKLYAVAYDGPPLRATPVFSTITGFCGLLFTLLFSGRLELPSLTTLLCGVSAGCVLFLYDLGNIRAAQTGPYSIQTIIGMFGSVLLPLLFESLCWGVTLTGVQYAGALLVLGSFVALNAKGLRLSGAQKGFYGWVALLFLSNGIYSILVAAQQRWTAHSQRSEMIAVVFLTMAVVSLLYLVFGCKVGVRTAFRLKKRCWCYALASSASLAAAMSLLVVLLGHISASILYPIQNGAILVLLVLLSAVHLRERIERHTVAGILLAVAGIAALSL